MIDIGVNDILEKAKAVNYSTQIASLININNYRFSIVLRAFTHLWLCFWSLEVYY